MYFPTPRLLSDSSTSCYSTLSVTLSSDGIIRRLRRDRSVSMAGVGLTFLRIKAKHRMAGLLGDFQQDVLQLQPDRRFR